MPIRMVDDSNDQFDNSNDNSGGGGGGRNTGGGGGGGILAFLPLLFGLFRKSPVLAILIAVVGGYFYFKGCGGVSSTASGLSLGGLLDPQQFAKAQIYEPVDDGKNPLPESVSLVKFAPGPGNQGQQGSCVAWSSAYAARTILESVSTGQDPNQIKFSPSFLYNQIGLDGCNGSYIIRAMETMTKVGSVPYNAFPYDDQDCSSQPSGSLKQGAQQFRMLGFTRLTDGDNTENLDVRGIKEHLAKDVPVVIGMMAGGTFMQDMMGQDVWHPTNDDYNMQGFGGHAICVMGYDDRKEGGAFLIQNSWGPEWGVDGRAWIRYSDFKHFVREAYGVNPMPLKGAAATTQLNCSIGLMEGKTKKYIPLKVKNGNVFETVASIKKGTQFKIEVKNNTACYVYVLGMETDGSSYVLFPYPSKTDPARSPFSPYCGITGSRLFPRGMSMMADSIGNKDYMAVITTKDSLDVFALNRVVTANKSAGFPQAINGALHNQSVRTSFTSSGGAMAFSTDTKEGDAVVCIVEIDKQ